MVHSHGVKVWAKVVKAHVPSPSLALERRGLQQIIQETGTPVSPQLSSLGGGIKALRGRRGERQKKTAQMEPGGDSGTRQLPGVSGEPSRLAPGCWVAGGSPHAAFDLLLLKRSEESPLGG